MTEMPLALRLAWRFSRGRQGKGFLSFISAASTLGIFIGVFALIVVLSVMNGFERELKERLLSVVPHAELIVADKQMITDWRQQIQTLQQNPQIVSASPVIKINAMAQKGKELKALEIRGVDPALEHNVSGIGDFVDTRQWQQLNQAGNKLILGSGVMETLNLNIGDKVSLLIPQLDESKKMRPPKSYRFVVVGSFSIGGQLDYGLGYMSIEQAQKLTAIDSGVQGIRLKLADVFAAPRLVRELGMTFPYHVYMYNWTITQGHLYQDIQLVRIVMYVVLALVIAVASFNIVSALVMTVHEKRGEIAILKTMGATEPQIVTAFVLQGLLNGLTGIIIGVALAVVTVINLPDLYMAIQSLFNVQLLQQDVYFINFLPTELKTSDIAATVLIALIMSICSTIYPALKANRIVPAKVLGN